MESKLLVILSVIICMEEFNSLILWLILYFTYSMAVYSSEYRKDFFTRKTMYINIE